MLIARTSVLDLEEIPSTFTYPPEYQGPKPIDEQIEAIAEIFGLDPTAARVYAKQLPILPGEAEGWFVVPKSVALSVVLEKLAWSRMFYVEPALLKSDRYRNSTLIDGVPREIACAQEGDILIVAAQLGFRHRGRKVRYAKKQFGQREFGLDATRIGAIALVHPERFVRFDELDIDCAGDEMRSFSGDYDDAPYFRFHQEWQNGVLTKSQLEFRSRWIGSAHTRCGTATGFIP